ncbi:MAG: hypothetical protein ACKVOB_13290 [Sphingomonas sp.]
MRGLRDARFGRQTPCEENQVPKRKKTILATEVPTIKFREGMFFIEHHGKISAYPPDLFIAVHAAAATAIRDWQESNAKSVVLLRERDGGH